MKKTVRIASLLLAMLLLVCSSALAETWHVDTDAMKQIEAADTFGIKVVKKEITDHAASNITSINLSNSANDVLTMTIESSLSEDVASFKILCVAVDDKGNRVDIQSSLYKSVSGSPSVTYIDYDEGIKAGETIKTNSAVDHSAFTGVRAIISEYTTLNGKTVENPAAEMWEYLAMGAVVGEKDDTPIQKAIDDQESFGACITSKACIRRVDIVGNDAMIFVVKNTGSRAITSISIGMMGFDANGIYKQVDANGPSLRLGNNSIFGWTSESISIMPGEEYCATIKCKPQTGINSTYGFVTAYTSADGTVHEYDDSVFMQFAISGNDAATTVLD